MSSIKDLKSKLNENWMYGSIADDHRAEMGSFSASKHSANFDASSSRSGGDVNDIARLAEKLSQQYEYNNHLLRQLQELETKTQQQGLENKDKENTLRSIFTETETLRRELEESKRKLVISHELSEAMSQQCRDARGEANNLRRELETGSRDLDEAKHEGTIIRQQNYQIDNRLKEMQMELLIFRETAEKNEESFKVKHGDLIRAHTQISHEKDELRSKCAMLDEQVANLRNINHVQSREVEDTKARITQTTSLREESEKSMRDCESILSRLRERVKELEFLLSEETSQKKSLETRFDQLKREREVAENESRVQSAKTHELARSYRDLSESHRNVQLELDKLVGDMTELCRQRQSEQDYWSKSSAEFEEMIAGLTEELRRCVEDNEDKLTDMTVAHRRDKTKYESDVVKLQSEHSHLHEILDACQKNAKMQTTKFDTERNDLKSRISDLSSQKEDLDNELEGDKHRHALEEDRLLCWVEYWYREMVDRGSRYASMLATMQEAIRSLKKEAEDVKITCSDVVGCHATLKHILDHFVREDEDKRPFETWYVETRAAFTGLIDQRSEAIKKVESFQDDLRRSELICEQEKGKVLLLEELTSRQDHDLTVSDNRNKDIERRNQESMRNGKRENDEIRRQLQENEVKCARIQSNLEGSMTQNRSLQEDNQRVQSNMTEYQRTCNAKAQEMEEKQMQIARDNKTLQKQVEDVHAQRSSLQVKLSKVTEDKSQANNALSQARNAIETKTREVSSIQSRSNQQVSALGDSLSKCQQQLQQTQGLLGTVQEQRKQLQQENRQLRADWGELMVNRSSSIVHAPTSYEGRSHVNRLTSPPSSSASNITANLLTSTATANLNRYGPTSPLSSWTSRINALADGGTTNTSPTHYDDDVIDKEEEEEEDESLQMNLVFDLKKDVNSSGGRRIAPSRPMI